MLFWFRKLSDDFRHFWVFVFCHRAYSKTQKPETFKNTFFTDLWATASEFVTYMLIFTSSRSKMFFKISVLKNFAVIKEALSNNKVTELLLQNTYGACFWIFVTANTFFLLNMVFIADSHTGFCSGLLWKHELNLRSSHWSCS